MLIGICGARCAGKSTVAQYLVEHHGFEQLYLEKPRGGQDEQQQHQGQARDGTPTTTTTTTSEAKNGTQRQPQPQPQPRPRTFASEGDLVDFVTKHWRSRWVTTDVRSEAVLDALSRRPFFILVSVDAPVTVRWRRHQARRQRRVSNNISSNGNGNDIRGDNNDNNNTNNDDADDADDGPISLEAFVAESDAHLYDADTGVLPLMSRASIRLLNTSDSIAHLYATLGKLDLADPERLRPSWDSYFMALASLAARRCNCMKRAVGCVLVDGRRRAVIATGYNGTPRGLPNCADGGCPRCNAGDAASGVALATCLCLHAEENALLEAGRGRVSGGDGGGNGNGSTVLYCNTCPCLTCSIKIVQVGIREVVYSQGYSMDGETARVFMSAGVKLRQFSPPAEGLIQLEKMSK
ncbi:cytidine deaminase-like protein [Nemania serpens]|nr:cytidine deaminase-like protein [Nemania serpens]